MTAPISSLTSTTPDPATKTTPASKTALDKDAFMKLLVAQISHQDPMAPMQGTEFVSQLSQFAMVEQAVAQSSKLDLLSTQLGGLSNSETTALVGKSVTVRGHSIAFDGLLATQTNVSLDAPAASVTVNIKDAQGRVVRTLPMGARPAGAMAIAWDGRDESGTPVAKGSYTVDVQAKDAQGNSVNASQDVTGIVTKVSFEKGYPELLLDSGAGAPVSDLVSVGTVPTNK